MRPTEAQRRMFAQLGGEKQSMPTLVIPRSVFAVRPSEDPGVSAMELVTELPPDSTGDPLPEGGDPGELPPFPDFEDDPIITQPDAIRITIPPEAFPDVEVDLPPGAELPPDTPIKVRKPHPGDTPDFPVGDTPSMPPSEMPFNTDQTLGTNPSMDPCNSGMPAPGGGMCGPANPADTPIGQAPGSPSGTGGFPRTGPTKIKGTHPGGGSHPGGGGGTPGGGGGTPGGEQPGSGKYFEEDKCYKNELVTVIILELATMLELDPSKVIVDESCEERYTGCFKKGSNIFDAIKKMANICGGVFNPGDGGGIYTPPHPKNVHHFLNEYEDIFYLERLYDNQDNFDKVEIFRPARFVAGVYYPAVSKVAEVYSPFNPSLDSVKTIFNYDYNLTDSQLQNLADVEAAKTSGTGAKCQITVLWQRGGWMSLYEQVHLQRPSIGWFTRWMIKKMEHSFSPNGHLTVLEATWLSNEDETNPFPEFANGATLNPVLVGLA